MVLYIVPVPIGNLADITRRGVDVLNKVDFIIAEDTRYSRKLLTHLGIKKKLVSYFKHREQEKTAGIIKLLKARPGALITDSGTPLISDPGLVLIQQAIQNNIQIVPLPGPTAFVPALVSSGFRTDKFLFLGFPPRKTGELKRFLDNISQLEYTLIFYESAKRTKNFLCCAYNSFDSREFIIAKELSKMNEKIIRGDLSNLEGAVGSELLLGEIVVIIAGNKRKKTLDKPELNSLSDIFLYFKTNFDISKNQLKKALMNKN